MISTARRGALGRRTAVAGTICRAISRRPCYKCSRRHQSALRGRPIGGPRLSREGFLLDKIKSIAVPVTRKRLLAPRIRPSRPLADDDGSRRPQRSLVPREDLAKHQYRVGDRVRMTGGGNHWARNESVCRIVALLPHERGPLLYRVQSEAESYQRVVEETDLSALG